MISLMDSSVLIGLAVEDHEFHDVAVNWFAAGSRPVATCPIVEGALVRHVVRNGRGAAEATAFLVALAALPTCEFWPDDLAFADVSTRGIRGHRQVTDAYLAELARRRSAKLATFDKGLAVLHGDVAELVATA